MTEHNPNKANAFSKWYESNKESLAEKRKQRYANDPEYRERAKANRANQLAKTRSSTPLPDRYTTTFQDAAEELGIGIWKFRHWRKNNYFPEPYQFGKYLYFTDSQIDLLGALEAYLANYPRLPGHAKPELDNLVNLIHTNWNA